MKNEQEIRHMIKSLEATVEDLKDKYSKDEIRAEFMMEGLKCCQHMIDVLLWVVGEETNR